MTAAEVTTLVLTPEQSEALSSQLRGVPHYTVERKLGRSPWPYSVFAYDGTSDRAVGNVVERSEARAHKAGRKLIAEALACRERAGAFDADGRPLARHLIKGSKR